MLLKFELFAKLSYFLQFIYMSVHYFGLIVWLYEDLLLYEKKDFVYDIILLLEKCFVQHCQ